VPAITPPTSSLFNVSAAPGRAYLVETDPQFTYRQWTSSDVLLAQLGVETTLQRLGVVVAPVVDDAAHAATADAAGQAQDSRTQALATANTAIAAYNAVNSLATASALNISVSVGTSKNQSHSEQSTSVAATSSVNAGGNLTISATARKKTRAL
jgi:hypothetical protein